MKNSIARGALLGLTAGLIATFFDSFYMLSPDMYVPARYPVVLLFTNVSFWSVFGSIAGACRYFLYCRKHPERQMNRRSWLLFFLLPFAFLSGLVGRFSDATVLSPGFDKNAVFLVVIAFIVFVFLRGKSRPGSESKPGLFIPEMLAITALLHFCSNIAQLTWVQTVFGHIFAVDFVSETERFLRLFNRYCFFLYGLGVLCIISVYGFVSRRAVAAIKPALPAAVCAAAAVLCAGVCFQANRSSFLQQYDHIAELQQHPAHANAFPVILIVLDTLRKRSLDEHPDVFKNLTAFARESLVFESCVANSSWTLPSHASMFTGLAPHEHGTHFMHELPPWFDGWPPVRPLSDAFTTLAEVFADNGYLTSAVASNFGGLNPVYGINRGFQVYDCWKSIGFLFGALPFKPLVHALAFVTNVENEYVLPYRKAEDVNDAVAQVLRRLPSGPFFLFINYMDPHDPYMPTNRFRKFFFGPLDFSGHALVRKARSFLSLQTQYGQCAINELLYKGEMAYLDYHVGRLLEQLKAQAIYDDALIVITSDHGELFCEHGYSAHKTPLYEGVTRVPLFIRFPRQQVTGTEHHYITLADLYPTILTICGLPYSEMISAKPFGRPAGPVVAEFYHYDTGEHRALYGGTYKYMAFERGKPNALYDLADDPRTENNLVDAMPGKTAEMEALLADWVGQHAPRYDEESLKKMEFAPVRLRDDLRSLGYIQ